MFHLLTTKVGVSMRDWPSILVKAGAIGLVLGLISQLILSAAPSVIQNASLSLGVRFTIQITLLLAISSTLLASLSALTEIQSARRKLNWKFFWASVVSFFQIVGLVVPFYSFMNNSSTIPFDAILGAGAGAIGTVLYLTFFVKRKRPSKVEVY
jgi:hypothetical protein